MLLRLLLAVVLLETGAAALAVVGFVALDGRAGGAPFAVPALPTTTSTTELQPPVDADTHPEPTATAPGSASTAEPGAVPAPPARPQPGQDTTTSAPAGAPGLHDLPPFPEPTGYEIRDRWSDGPSRLTLWQPVDGDTPGFSDIYGIIEFGTGDWTTSRSGEADGVTWATLTAVGHPWCVWVEIYGDGTDGPVPTFLIVEGPFCDSQPGSFV